MRFGLVALAIVGAFGCSGSKTAKIEPVVTLDTTTREIAQGDVIGYRSTRGADVWAGLPFAAPPVGDMRWRAPRPPEGWAGVRDATEFSDRCPQVTNGLNEAEGLEPGLKIGSEDCLYLNVYAPPMSAAEAANADLPVMVWIHGGSNVWGRASSYDGSALAVNENVIIVTIQYRLGPLGWFAHEAIRESADMADAGMSADRAANFAILDQIAALDWVRGNIDAFGGDAGNVTIFGESAGGHNVAALLASPTAKGLFHRAIIQSGLFASAPLEEAEFGGGEPNHSRSIAEKLGADTARDLRDLSVEKLLDAYLVEGRIELPRVIEDGVSLPAAPMIDAFRSTDTFNAVPIITGTNKDELKLFRLLAPEFTKRYFGLFVVSRDKGVYNSSSDIESFAWRVSAVDRAAALMTEAGHEDVWAYRFDWDDAGRFLISDFSHLLGAAHAMEIPFVFNRFELFGRLDSVVFNKKTKAEREDLSRVMGGYWAAFAREGAPQAQEAPAWPRWSERAEGAILRLDTTSGGGIEVIDGGAKPSDVAEQLATDTHLSAEQKCRLGKAIDFWLPGFTYTHADDYGCAGASK